MQAFKLDIDILGDSADRFISHNQFVVKFANNLLQLLLAIANIVELRLSVFELSLELVSVHC